MDKLTCLMARPVHPEADERHMEAGAGAITFFGFELIVCSVLSRLHMERLGWRFVCDDVEIVNLGIEKIRLEDENRWNHGPAE